MCGIAGFSRTTAVTRFMAPLLAWEIDKRGKDSWGVTNGHEDKKKLGPITETFEMPDWDGMIFHTRAASQGKVCIDNQHPFRFDKPEGGKVVGVHNGCLTNHTTLNTANSRSFEVDSMHIYAHIAEGKSTEELSGWGALAWYEHMVPAGQHMTIRLARFNMADFYVCVLNSGEVVFCSYREAIEKSAKMAGTDVKVWYKMEPNETYFIARAPGEPNADCLFKGKDLKFGSRVVASTYSTGKGSVTYYPKQGRTLSDLENDFDKWEQEYAERRTRIGYDNLPTVSTPPKSSTKRPSLDQIDSYRRSKNICMKCTKTADRTKNILCEDCSIKFITNSYKPRKGKCNATSTTSSEPRSFIAC